MVNDKETMAETTEVFDELLNLELLDHYERMTTKKRMSTEAMQQWLTGAAFHLHIRIHQVGKILIVFQQQYCKWLIICIKKMIDLIVFHQVRLKSMPVGAAESLRRSFKSQLNQLIGHYTVYLRRNIRETAAPKPGKRKNRQSSVLRHAKMVNQTSPACSGTSTITSGTATGELDELSASNAAANISRKCKREVLEEVSGGNVTDVTDKNPVGTEKRKKLRHSSGINSGALGLLVIEPLRNVSHSVQHHPCESPAIQQALVTRFMDALDMEQNKQFFQYPQKVFLSLLRQDDDFEI